MTNLTTNMTATQVVNAIVGNLQELESEVSVSMNDTATSLCTKLNGVFDGMDGVDILSEAQSASAFVASVNKNFGIAESFDPVIPVDESDLADIPDFKFLHITDTHGQYTNAALTEQKYNQSGLERCQRVMTEGDSLYDSAVHFVFHTGDLGSSYQYPDNNTGGYKNYREHMEFYTMNQFNVLGLHLLYVKGNHCAFETSNIVANNSNVPAKYAKFYLRSLAEDWMSASGVTWGNTTSETFTNSSNEEVTGMKRGIYWHKDYPLNENRKLRVIGLDLYDVNKESTPSYANKISSEQAQWFVARLAELNPQDFFVIGFHEPPIYDVEIDDASTTTGKSCYRTRARSINPFNDVRDVRWLWNDFSTNADSEVAQGQFYACNFIVNIVDAYLTKSSGSQSKTWKDGTTTTATYSFSKDPATFICYLTGHTHNDNNHYHNVKRNQLISVLDTTGGSHAASDLNWQMISNSYYYGIPNESVQGRPLYGSPINKITLDFVNKRIRIERLGINICTHHTVDRSTTGDRYDSHADGYTYGVDNTYVKGGGYYDGSTYHSTNIDGSINDDVDYVRLDTGTGQITHILTYTYENGQVVATVTDASGNPVSGFSINRNEFYMRRKKISFPFKRTVYYDNY